jgi:hypothetical protein
MSAYTIYQAAAMPVSQWAGGSTRQLAISPAAATVAAQDFQWRFSSATVSQSGPFTAFPNHQRLLALRQGAGFVLQVDAQQQVVHSTSQVMRFAGQANSQAQLIDGAVVDINLMFRQGLQAQLWSQPCTADFATLQHGLPKTATLLIYADTIALEIDLELQQPPIQLEQGNVLQLHPPISSFRFRAISSADGRHFTSINADAAPRCQTNTDTAVFAWLAAVD